MKYFIIAGIISIGGAVAFLALAGDEPAPSPDNSAIAAHWSAIRHYRDFIYNPDNFEADPDTGIRVASPPDPLPSLAALVSAGEIEHVDLVLPTVPHHRLATRFWLQWAEVHKDEVWHMTGNPQYVDYKPAGEQPLHVQIWFSRSAKPKVQQLIKDLEALPTNGRVPHPKALRGVCGSRRDPIFSNHARAA